jgi:invasion protein IalB
MSKSAMLAAAAIFLTGVIAAGAYVWTRTSAAHTHQWAVVPHPPSDRLSQKTRVLREFGDWHLTCRTVPPPPPPKFGFIQNFGILPQHAIDKPSGDCRTFIFMADRENPQRVMVLDLRFGPGNALLMATAVYPVLGKVGDRVTLKLNQESLAFSSRACGRKRCYATLNISGQDIDDLVDSDKITAQLPPSPDGERDEIYIPTRGLNAALSALKKLNPS